MAPSIYDDRYKSREMLADKNWGEWEKQRLSGKVQDAATPKMPPAMAGGPVVNTQNVTVSQTLQFTGAGAVDPEKARRVHGEAVQKAYRQMSAQTRSN
jgi:hypothetical protein